MRRIKVSSQGRRGIETTEVSFEEAKMIVEDALAWGSLVVDEKTGKAIYWLDSNVEEIFIMDGVGGG